MNVAAAARRTGLSAKTIRYYEDIGLIRPARAGNGYRDYSSDDIHRLAFLRRARGLGFSIEDCRQLMALYRDKSRASHDVREIAKPAAIGMMRLARYVHIDSRARATENRSPPGVQASRSACVLEMAKRNIALSIDGNGPAPLAVSRTARTTK